MTPHRARHRLCCARVARAEREGAVAILPQDIPGTTYTEACMNVVRAHMIVSARAHMTIDKLIFLRVKPTGEASGSLVGYVRHAEKPFLNLEARLTSDPGQHLEGVTEFFFLFKRMPVSVGALGAHAPPRTALTVTEYPGPAPTGISFVVPGN